MSCYAAWTSQPRSLCQHPGGICRPGRLRGVVPGLDGFAVFCFLVAVTIDNLGGLAALGLATAAAVIIAIVLMARAPGPDVA